MHVADALQQAFDAALSHQRSLQLIVDTAPAENGHEVLSRLGVHYLSLFDGTPEESLIEIAPLLIPVNGLDADTRRRVFEWAEKLAYTAPCLTWFETDASPQDMARHLRQFHVVGLTEGQSMLMRWYDTRILPVWFACLTREQAQMFAARVTRWAYVDRFGEVSVLATESPAAGFPPDPPFGEPSIKLTDAQYGMLVDATELDVLVKHLRQIIPDETKRVPSRVFTEFVSKHQQAAIAAGFDDIDRQAQYVVLALYTSGKCIESPEFKALLTTPPLGFDELAKGIQDLPDEVSNVGTPLWDAMAMSA
ncbi:MAG: DUF4123 domain-containing protein [Rhizobacter sp.]